MATIPVKDANNTTVDLEKPLPPGRAAALASRPVALSTEDLAALVAIVDAIEAGGGGGGTPGRAAAAASSPVVLSTEDFAALSAISGGGGASDVTITDSDLSEYETVAASATDQALGATGATGDYLSGVLIVPVTTSPGAVSIKDGSGPAIPIFTGGTSSVSNLVPFFVPLGIKSTGGAWKVTTGAAVSAIGVGAFT